MKDRKNCCPKCGYALLAISDNKVICLRPDCTWSVEAKREEDKNLPDYGKLKRDWQ